MVTEQQPLNWVDPDLIAYYEETGQDMPELSHPREGEFRRFFAEEWYQPEFDDIRETWDPLINDESAHARLLAKVALWNLAQYRRLRSND